MRPVTWKELRQICILAGCVDSRTQGSHLVMTRPGLARPIIIKMAKGDLGPRIVMSNMRTLGLTREEFEQLLDQVRRKRKVHRTKSKSTKPGRSKSARPAKPLKSK